MAYIKSSEYNSNNKMGSHNKNMKNFLYKVINRAIIIRKKKQDMQNLRVFRNTVVGNQSEGISIVASVLIVH